MAWNVVVTDKNTGEVSHTVPCENENTCKLVERNLLKKLDTTKYETERVEIKDDET